MMRVTGIDNNKSVRASVSDAFARKAKANGESFDARRWSRCLCPNGEKLFQYFKGNAFGKFID